LLSFAFCRVTQQHVFTTGWSDARPLFLALRRPLLEISNSR